MQPVTVGGVSLPAGALLVPASEDGARAVLADVSEATGLPVYAGRSVPDGPAIRLADDTRIGLIRGAQAEGERQLHRRQIAFGREQLTARLEGPGLEQHPGADRVTVRNARKIISRKVPRVTG